MPTVGDRSAENGGDADLVERILADPTVGWTDAWNRYGHRLHSYCRRRLDNPSEADDAVADVFLVASQRIGSLREPAAFTAWMYAIARRRVQVGWRERQRTSPVDPQADTLMSTTAEVDVTGGAEAAELVAAASSSLSERDRDLLTLALGADLDTGEIARITGDSIAFVSVRVTRLKERVGRAAGALLVARQHRRHCDDLDELLVGWDGTFDMKWRNRIARHVDDCDECSQHRKAATAVFATPLLFAPPSTALQDRVLEPISSDRAIAPDLGPWDDQGFPANRGARRRTPLVLAAAAVLVAVVIALGLFGRSESTANSLHAVGADTPTTEQTSPPSSSPTTAVDHGTDPSTSPTTAPTNSQTRSTVTMPQPVELSDNTTASSETTETIPSAPPMVSLTLSPASIWAGTTPAPGIDVTSQAIVEVQTVAEEVSTLVSWDGPQAGSVVLSGSGTHYVTVGPFDQAPTNQTVTVTALTTDHLGQTGSHVALLQVTDAPI